MAPKRHGESRQQIIDAAVDLASARGLAGLSFGGLAAEVGLTRAGVAAHFESKQALQLAAVARAAEAYRAPLDRAAQSAEPGLARLRALVRAWLDHLEAVPYRGGCFFASVGLDLAARPGPVRDDVARQTAWLVGRLDEQARLAARLGELAEEAAPELLVFQLHALAQEANLRRQLLDDADAFETARLAVDEVLLRVSAPPARTPSSRPPAQETP